MDPQTFSRSKIWIISACVSSISIVGEVYSELHGLQAWVVGQKKHTFQITLTEQQIFK